MSNKVYAKNTLTLPADTVAYAAADILSSALATNGIEVSAATNATPIVVTTTAAHGLSTDDEVYIAGCSGNTGANGKFKIVVLSSTTFSLVGSTGNGAWTSGGTVAKQLKLAGLGCRGGAGIVEIQSVTLTKSGGTVTNGQFRVHLFNAPPTLADDNVALAIASAEHLTYVGSVDVTLQKLGSCGGKNQSAVNLITKCPAGGVDLYAVIEALAAYTKASGEVFQVQVGGIKHLPY